MMKWAPIAEGSEQGKDGQQLGKEPGCRTDPPAFLPWLTSPTEALPCFVWGDLAVTGSGVEHKSSEGAWEGEQRAGCSQLWVLPSKASANADPWQDPSKGSFGNVFALLMTYPWSFCLCFAFKERPIITGSNNYSTGEAGKQNSFSKASLGLPDLLKENPNKCDSLPCPSSWLAVSLMFIPHLGLLLVQWSLQAKELTNLV